jgi:hypothetical protein
MYAERVPPDTPPCRTCRVELLPENEETADVYMLTRRQAITTGMGNVVDINLQAIKTVMDLHGVKNQKECMERVRKAFFHFLNEESGNG